ncbi:MAG: hypothetical protein AB8H03_27115 [Saprospiraceae bacterium]
MKKQKKRAMVDWKTIDDKKAIQMLNEIFDNIDNDELLFEYMTALETKYRKPNGTISDFIFYDDLTIDEIMVKLKTDNVTYL